MPGEGRGGGIRQGGGGAHEEDANEEEEDANKEEDEEGMTLCKSLYWLLTFLVLFLSPLHDDD